MAKRTADQIRSERETVSAKIEKLRLQKQELSAELRDVEGPIPDRTGRPTGVGYRIVKASAK
jgi:uncharacterized coiled-coil DUF342 family protein